MVGGTYPNCGETSMFDLGNSGLYPVRPIDYIYEDRADHADPTCV